MYSQKVRTYVHTWTHTRMFTHSHVHTHTPNTWTCTHTIFNPTHSHCQRVCMYTHTFTRVYSLTHQTLGNHTPHSSHVLHIALPCTTSGKINLENAVTRWKWGVGRLIAECTKTPIVIPVWHVGMEDILPTRSPYIPQLFKVRAANASLHPYTKRSLSSVLTNTSCIVPLLQYFSQQLHTTILLSFSFPYWCCQYDLSGTCICTGLSC